MPEELPCMSNVSNLGKLKQSKITLGLDLSNLVSINTVNVTFANVTRKRLL